MLTKKLKDFVLLQYFNFKRIDFQACSLIFYYSYWTYKSERNTFFNNDTFIPVFIFIFIFLAT